jgi:hypothetical protein
MTSTALDGDAALSLPAVNDAGFEAAKISNNAGIARMATVAAGSMKIGTDERPFEIKAGPATEEGTKFETSLDGEAPIAGTIRRATTEERQSFWERMRDKAAAMVVWVAGAAAVAGATETAKGGMVLDDGYNPIAAAQAHKGGTAYLIGDMGGTTVYFSGVPLPDPADPTHSSNILLTAHQNNVQGTPVTFSTAGNGANYLTDPGTVVGIKDVVIIPGYNENGSTPDLAIAHLSAPLPIAWNGMVDFTPDGKVTFATVSPGETIYGTGFGVWGTAATGLHLPDGNSRRWSGSADMDAHGFSNDFYYVARFDAGGVLFGPDNGRALNFDSGGAWYNASGQLVGLTDFGGASFTGIEKLWDPTITQQINDNMQTSIVPEPTSAAMLMLGLAGILVLRTRRGCDSAR